MVIDASVGRPAERMGDVTGDGLDDLVFIKPTTPGNFEIIVIAGGNGAGVEIPRLVDYDWVEETLGVNNQERVQRRFGTPAASDPGFDLPSATLSVLNYNDDGHADSLLVKAGSGALTLGAVTPGHAPSPGIRRTQRASRT